MKQGVSHLDELYRKFLENRITPGELEELLVYFKDCDDEQLAILIRSSLHEDTAVSMSTDLKRSTDLIYREIREKISHNTRTKRLSHPWKYAAAIVLLCVAGIGLFYHFAPFDRMKTAFHTSQTGSDIAPGVDRAVLHLSDGTAIDLNQVSVGEMITQSNAAIRKISSGSLEYALANDVTLPPGNQERTTKIATHRITTPLGGQYTVVLPDGSTVHLNAGSSLTYPVVFNGRERRVSMTGEGFFEVSRDVNRPFVVESPGQEVEVLGTHFNINAYGDDNVVKTTLLEGSVRVTTLMSGETDILDPGQQALVTERSMRIVSADMAEATAWKNGLFVFHNTHLKNILRQLKRWYKVDIDTAGLPDEHFFGEISRNVQLSEVLDMIESTSTLRFQVKGRRVLMEKD